MREIPDVRPLLTIDQVAKRIGVHPQTVRQYIKDGSLGHVRLGGQRFVRRRVREDQLTDFIEGRSVAADWIARNRSTSTMG